MSAARRVRFSVATYNIHKGISRLKRRVVIHELRERLRGLDPDIVFLQEVLHTNDRHADRFDEWPLRPQHEYLADSHWREAAYGRNAVYPHGNHGNALLSRFPVLAQQNLDISAHVFESRGLLHCEISLGDRVPHLHCMNVHLGLFERGRQMQIRALVDRIVRSVPRNAPLIIAGDFNDWRSKGDRALTDALELVEVFEQRTGHAARTYPSLLPMFRLDRIYVRGLAVVDAKVHYVGSGPRMSDHAALAATFEFTSKTRH